MKPLHSRYPKFGSLTRRRRRTDRDAIKQVFLFWLLNAMATCATADDFTVGDITVPRGEQLSGFIAVPEGIDEATQIPVTIAHGAAHGPTLALIAGIHGYEYPPITALQALRARLDPAILSGTVIMVHIANLPSFFGRTVYYSPCLLYTSPSPRDKRQSRMPSSA